MIKGNDCQVSAENAKWKAKCFLYGYIEAKRELERIENELRDLQEEAESVSIKLDGMPRGTEISDRTGNFASRIADMCMETIEQRSKAWEKRKAVVDLINGMSKDHAKILYSYFVKQQTFEQIAVEMGFSFRHIMRLYGNALEEAYRNMS